MKLYSPIKKGTFRNQLHNTDLKSLADLFRCQTQGFGGNYDIYKQFGLMGHNGLDFAYEDGTGVYASHDGTVNFQEDSMKGLGAVVADSEKKTIYWHLKSYVGSNREVKQGELIGLGDSTGFSTGPHLHYGLKLLDSNGNVLNRDNGYDGAIDPTPYLVWYDQSTPMTAEEVTKEYSLAFYRLPTPSELTYWTGKPLIDFLDTAIADRARFLSAQL